MSIVQQFKALLKDLFQWWITIVPWEQGIRVRFGKHVKLLPTGIYLKLPMFDTVYVQAIRVRAQVIVGQTISSKDGKAISLASALQYEIIDLLKLYKTLHNAHDTIELLTQGIISSFINRHFINEIEPTDIEEHVLENIDLSMYGLKVHGFKITDFAVVKTFRLIGGVIGSFTGYDQRFKTTE